MGAKDRVELLMAVGMIPNPALKAEEIQARWADYGRAVHANMLTEDGLEQVITRLALQPGQTTKTIAQAIRVYLTTATRP